MTANPLPDAVPSLAPRPAAPPPSASPVTTAAGALSWLRWRPKDAAPISVRAPRSPTQLREPSAEFIAARVEAAQRQPGWWIAAANIRKDAVAEAHALGLHITADRHHRLALEYERRVARPKRRTKP